MTPIDIIARVDAARPNDLSAEQKMDMIARLDSEAIKDTAGYLAPPMILEYDSDQTLFIPFPFDDCYVLYCFAQMDLILSDMQAYQNDSVAFNSRYQDYINHIKSTGAKPNRWMNGRYAR